MAVAPRPMAGPLVHSIEKRMENYGRKETEENRGEQSETEENRVCLCLCFVFLSKREVLVFVQILDTKKGFGGFWGL